MTTCTAPFPVRITASAPSGRIIHVRAVTVSTRKRAVIQSRCEGCDRTGPVIVLGHAESDADAYKPGLRILVRFQIRVYQ